MEEQTNFTYDHDMKYNLLSVRERELFFFIFHILYTALDRIWVILHIVHLCSERFPPPLLRSQWRRACTCQWRWGGKISWNSKKSSSSSRCREDFHVKILERENVDDLVAITRSIISAAWSWMFNVSLWLFTTCWWRFFFKHFLLTLSHQSSWRIT